MRRLSLTVLLLAALALPAAASAADPLGLACADQGDGIRLCQGKVKTFDGVPLDANPALPAGSGLPLVVLSHGYGGSKLGYADMKPWAQRGYAVLAFSARGFGESCGSAASRLADPVGCAEGWVRLDDVRYEARDIQQLAASWPTPAWSTARGWESPAARTAAAYRWTWRFCATGSCCPTAACGHGPRPQAGRCGSPARCRGSRGATSPTRWPPTGARSTTRSPRRPPISSPSGSPSSPSSPASTPRARPAATTRRRASLPTPISPRGSPRSTPASPTAHRSAPSPTSSPRTTPPTTSTTRARPRRR